MAVKLRKKTGATTFDTAIKLLEDSDVPLWAKASTKPSYSWSEITNKPTSLPANGGNSDTVDSYHAEQILAYGRYKYHDIAAFCNLTTPVYEISADGSTGWTEATLDKNIFAAREAFSMAVTNTSQKGARFTWKGGFSWSSLAYCIIGWTYRATPATVTLKFESSNDSGSTWTDRGTITDITTNAAPAFYNISSVNGDAWFRVTILQTSSTGEKAISTIKLLTARWGDQGLGSEYEKPYTADGDKNIAPWNNNTQNLGSSSKQWNNFYAKTIYENGTALSSKYLGISSKAADSSKLNGQEASYYLNYNNLSNKPTIPADTNYYPSRSYSSGLQISTSTNVTNTCALYVPYATADQYGVVKPAAVRSSAITATTGGTTSNRYYGVEKDSNGKLFVNVPWSSSGTTTWNSDWGYTLKSYQGATFGNCYFIDCPGSYCFGCGDSGFFIDAKGIYQSAEEADNMLLVNRDENAIIINRNILSSIGLWDSSEGSWTGYWSLNFPSAVGDAGTFALGEKTCGFARCTTSSSTAVKEVTLYNECSDLVDGSMFFLDMDAGNTNTSMSFSIGGLKTFSISNIYVNDSAMSSSYYAFPSGTYLCCVRSNKLYCYPKSLYYYSTTPATSTSTSHVIYKGTFSTNGSATAIATMFHNFKKVVTVYGTEKSQYGTIRIYRDSSEIVAQATGEQGYWAKQDLCLTAIIPAGVDAYLYKTSNMNNLTYHVEVIS